MVERHYYLIGFAAIICYALLSPIVRKLSLGTVPPFAFMMIANGFLFLFAVIGYWMMERGSVAAMQPITWIWMFGFALLNFLGYYLYIKALSGMPVTSYQLMALATPIIGGLFAWYLLKEPITVKMLVGFAIMCAGFYIAIAKKPFGLLG